MHEPLSASTAADPAAAKFDAWHPGLDSEIPRALAPLATIFRAENAFTGFHEVHELAHLTGLAADELAIFRPERLVVHELLIRVTANLSVPDGPRQEDLGIAFRRMVQTILARHIEPHMAEIVAAYETLRRALSDLIDAELGRAFAAVSGGGAASAARPRAGGLLGMLRRADRKPEPARAEDDWDREERIVREWSAGAQARDNPLRRAACRALARVASGVRAQHGRLWGDRSLLAPIALGIACNDHGTEAVGALIEPHLRRAAAAEGYRLLPAQARPVVMNTKGASASGKSTMRPLQRRLAAELGLDWGDFAVISPDIWRKYLLDYDALGAAYKYAGPFAAAELAIVDHKLDRYMARKAEHAGMPHLLIDRFRFDSFAPDSSEAGSNLLTRFGREVYMFFMITPPHETVERAWRRGLEFGRYKAVDDTLAHNVEAYSGMPDLFFTWALREGMSVHCEFLDNSVPPGEQPRTIAFGRGGELNVLDVKCMLDVERYRKIDIDAAGPGAVYPGGDAMAAANNTRFLAECIRRLPAVNFADRDSGRVYARTEGGQLAWTDPEALARATADAETRAGLLAVVPAALARDGATHPPEVLRADRFHTLGEWGGAIARSATETA
jgi:hypothetical protein